MCKSVSLLRSKVSGIELWKKWDDRGKDEKQGNDKGRAYGISRWILQ